MADTTYDVGGPRCPNHRVLLVDCKKGVGICPVSSCCFTYDGNEAEKTKKLRLNAMGQYEEAQDWKVTPLDGDGG